MKKQSALKKRLHEIIFEADTPEGKAFDVVLIIMILLSVTVVVLDSVTAIHSKYAEILLALEWFFTIIFTIEYALRLFCLERPSRYARSFFGIVDIISIVPTYISILIPGVQALLIIRVLRLLRFFRVFKMARYVSESRFIISSLKASKQKIIVFLFTVLTIIIVVGALMHVVEGGRQGFENIPQGMYWAAVTLTTVGYGDVVPITALGKFFSVIIVIMGYGIIAVPTGIITVEMANQLRKQVSTQACPKCGKEGHEIDAKYCMKCGSNL